MDGYEGISLVTADLEPSDLAIISPTVSRKSRISRAPADEDDSDGINDGGSYERSQDLETRLVTRSPSGIDVAFREQILTAREGIQEFRAFRRESCTLNPVT